MNKFVKLIPGFILLIYIILINLNINAQEVVFLHTDKSDYISGETIQFKAYLIGNNVLQSSNVSTVIYFQLTGYEKIEFSGLRANVENGICKGQIYLPDSLKTGYYYLSAYTNHMRNYPIETYFNKKIFITKQNDEKPDSMIDYSIIKNQDMKTISTQPASDNSVICKIKTDKYSYIPGEKIRLNIKLDSLVDNKGTTNLSVSVSEQSPFEDTSSAKNIISHLNYITNEWKILSDNNYSSSTKFLTEKNGYILNGQLVSKINDLPLANVTVLLSSSDSIPDLQYYTTGQDGEFYFQLNKYYDNRILFLQLNDSAEVNKSYIFKFDDKKIYPQKLFKSTLNMNISEKIYLENSQKLVLINKIFNPVNQYKQAESTKKFKEQRFPFFGIPDETIIPADYEELADFMEMTQNYIRVVKFRKNADGFKLTMLDDESKLIQEENALFLLNSIPIFNYNVLKEIKGNTIQRIEMKKKHIMYGKLNFHGVLLVLTDPKLASIIYTNIGLTSFKNNVMIYTGDLPVNTNKLQENQSNKIPDFRQILYWNPEVILNDNNESNIEFSASEYKTKYNIDIQGITSDNKVVFSRGTIEVK